MDRLWRKLDAVNRELAWVTEAEYLSGLPTSPPTSPRLHQPLAVNNVVLHPHNLPTLAPPPPPVAPPPPPAPEPERQRQPERQPERVVLPDTPRFEGLPGGGKAEGTGKEVLLQVRRWWPHLWWPTQCRVPGAGAGRGAVRKAAVPHARPRRPACPCRRPAAPLGAAWLTTPRRPPPARRAAGVQLGKLAQQLV